MKNTNLPEKVYVDPESLIAYKNDALADARVEYIRMDSSELIAKEFGVWICWLYDTPLEKIEGDDIHKLFTEFINSRTF